MRASDYHYILDAASLLDKCRKRLAFILQFKLNEHILELDQVLLSTEQLIHCHLLTLVEKEKDELESSRKQSSLKKDEHYGKTFDRGISMMDETFMKNTMMDTANMLKEIIKRKRRRKRKMSFDQFIRQQQNQQSFYSPSNIPYPSTSIDGLSLTSSTGNCGKITETPFPDSTTVSRSSPVRSSEDNIFHPGSNKCQMMPFDNVGSNIAHANSTIAATTNSLHPERSADDSLLFRLAVILQLCLVRIEEAEKIIFTSKYDVPKENSNLEPCSDTIMPVFHYFYWGKSILFTVASTAAVILLGRRYETAFQRQKISTPSIIKGIGSISAALLIRRGWMNLCMNARLAHTMLSLEDWQHQWNLVLAVSDPSLNSRFRHLLDDSVGSPDEQSKHLLQLIPFQSSKVRFD